jgi:hypothetical protein
MDRDRVRGGVADFVLRVMGFVDFHALYPCRVISQNSDGTLELKPDTDRFGPGLSRIPIRLGLPGCKVKVKPQCRVLLGFEAGDAQRPYASLWEQGGLDEITITSDTKVHVSAPKIVLAEQENGARGVAMQGDIVLSGGPLTGLILGKPGTVSPAQTGVPYPVSWVNIEAKPPVPSPYLAGTITSASSKVKGKLWAADDGGCVLQTNAS